jgi:outer membrane protease
MFCWRCSYIYVYIHTHRERICHSLNFSLKYFNIVQLEDDDSDYLPEINFENENEKTNDSWESSGTPEIKV